MLERNELKMDPLLAEEFFSSASVLKEFVSIDFPLPDASENLRFFFASDEGVVFKNKMRELIAWLKGWAESNEIDSSPLDVFIKNYIDYTGRNLETNSLYFGLYHEGVPLLQYIMDIVSSGTTGADHSAKGVLEELIPKMEMCAPGVHTYLLDAYTALSASKNLPLIWLNFRRDLIQQLALMIAGKEVSSSWEVHYANALSNRYAEMMGVPSIDDEYAGKCDAVLLDKFFEKFERDIIHKCTIDNLDFGQLPRP